MSTLTLSTQLSEQVYRALTRENIAEYYPAALTLEQEEADMCSGTPEINVSKMLPVPELTKTNYVKWRFAVRAYAKRNQFSSFLLRSVPPPTATAKKKDYDSKLAHAQQLIVTYISDKILDTFGDDFFDLELHEMMTKVQDKMKPPTYTRKAPTPHESSSRPVFGTTRRNRRLRRTTPCT